MQAPSGNIRFLEAELTQARSIAEGLMPIPAEELERTVNMNRTKRKNWMRNKPCICGSGKKFKTCCWSKYK
jgi:uncharacterized protein YecA (UPF0149 family)